MICSGLKDKEEENGEIHIGEDLVEHTCTDFILIGVGEEMEHTDDREDGNKDDTDEWLYTHGGEVAERHEMPQCREMIGKDGVVAYIGHITQCEPVRHRQSEDGGDECADAQSHNLRTVEEPQQRYEIEQLNEVQRADAIGGIGIEGPAHGLSVLIAVEEQEIGGDDADAHHLGLTIGEEEGGHGHEHEEGTGHHPAVDTDEGIAVVEFHHEIGGEDRHEECCPHLAGPQTAQCPYYEGIDADDRQCKAVLRNLILKSFSYQCS